MPRRVPVPVLRPALDLCQVTVAALDPDERVVLVNDSGKVGKYLGYRLRARQVTSLFLDRATPDTADAQVREWLGQGPIAGVYFLPGMDVEAPSGADRPGSLARREREAGQDPVCDHARPAGQPLPGVRNTSRRVPRLWPEGATAPLGGAIVGFAKAYAMERPEALVKAVDFALGADERKVAECLINETLRDPGAVEIGCPLENAQGNPDKPRASANGMASA